MFLIENVRSIIAISGQAKHFTIAIVSGNMALLSLWYYKPVYLDQFSISYCINITKCRVVLLFTVKS